MPTNDALLRARIRIEGWPGYLEYLSNLLLIV